MMSAIAVIGGTGFERLHADFVMESIVEGTPFGQVSLVRVQAPGMKFLFLPRHGGDHGVVPHMVNYRANILALKQLGVERIIATNAVGSLRTDMAPGLISILDDFIDMTRGRPTTLWDSGGGDNRIVIHTDFTQPDCPQLRDSLIAVSESAGIPVQNRCTYV